MDDNTAAETDEFATPPDLPDTFKDLNEAQVEGLLMSTNSWFGREDIQERINVCISSVLDFLHDNVRIMSGHPTTGDIFVGDGPWRKFEICSQKDDVQVADLRRTLLRRNAFSEGLAFMLFTMRSKEQRLIGSSRHLKYFIDKATNIIPIEITQEMLFRSKTMPSYSKDFSFTLSGLRHKFLYAPNVNTSVIRNEWLAPMACLGLWSASRNKVDGQQKKEAGELITDSNLHGSSNLRKQRVGDFSITAGFVPKIFHEKVLVPYLLSVDKV